MRTFTFTRWKGWKKSKQRTEVAAFAWMERCGAWVVAPWLKMIWWAMCQPNGLWSGLGNLVFGSLPSLKHWIRPCLWRPICLLDCAPRRACQFNP